MSSEDIERGLVAKYLHRVLCADHIPTRAARYILYWLNDRTEMLSLPLPKKLSGAIGNIYSSSFSQADFNRAFQDHREEILAMLQEAASNTSWPEPMWSNIKNLTDALGLEPSSREIVALIACFHRFDQVQYLCNSVTESIGPLSRSLSLLTDLSVNEVERMTGPAGNMVAAGLLQIKSEGGELSGPGGHFSITSRLDACLDQRFKNFDDMRKALLGAPLEANIESSDYDHIREDRDLICKVLKGAVSDNAEGVNVLLYGPPGSGKTELTKVAAKKAGLSIYAAGEDVGAEGEIDRKGRLADLVFAISLLRGAKNTAILFDEMEDVALHLIRRGGSKVYLNRLLEKNPVPILWTSNNISDIDSAILRRMILAFELKSPPTAQRRRIIGRMAKRIGVKLSTEEVAALAEKLDATPAIMENALRVAKYSKGGAAAVERAAMGVTRAVSGLQARRGQDNYDYDPKLSKASRDIDDLSTQLKSSGKLNFSLCLSGPPGTGKSAYARYMARELGLEVIQKRASDIFSAFVGETEKRIADAFLEAKEANAFLIFDEADSFLYSRQDASRSWEVTQVNEMLTWMEEHSLPVCFTTNLMDRLDAASLRRFTFHVRFNFMDKEALKQAYKLFFNLDKIPAHGLKFENLTPGDFAQVYKQAEVLGALENKDRIIALLKEVSQTKPGNSENIGFFN